ncbi:hypothetical protein F5148DRAFT_1249974 [Russula earlei]|uniref:Uncharacterized protein n=1 Tax=Russula earlei TaxID=71964 RepID=A0ACC0TUF3_9AGAM|nr:hypothetical protein F5148DRAFT_1249974 [Russula earlei]
MRTSAIFAIFCLAGGMVPSLALPSHNPPQGKLSHEEIKELVSQRKGIIKAQRHQDWNTLPDDVRAILIAHKKTINSRIYAHDLEVAKQNMAMWNAKEMETEGKGTRIEQWAM